MTTTERIRETSSEIVESDLPPEMTIAEYRRGRENSVPEGSRGIFAPLADVASLLRRTAGRDSS